MTASQVRWASQHDWFLSSKQTDYVYTVIVTGYEWSDMLKEYYPIPLQFTDINELKAWAGY